MPTKKVVEEHKQMMHKAVDFLKSEFHAVRTGRAHPGLVEHLSVEYYGTPTPLKQIATIAAPEAAMIIIKPFDPSSLKDIEKAVKSSDLSLAPVSDGKVIRLHIPPLSEERRKQIVQQIKQMGEKTKISIRNLRRDGIKKLEDDEKAKLFSEDDRDKGKKDIDNLTKDFTDEIDSLIKAKSEEIMSN